jgi:hypothetical protein
MLAELGQTNDPRALIPGDPEAIAADLRALTTSVTATDRVGEALRNTGRPPGWTGDASEAFHANFSHEPPKWASMAEDLGSGGTAVAEYADVLNWSQGRAQQAIEVYAQAEAASQAAARRYDALQATPGAPPMGPFVDAGGRGRQQAHAILDDARAKQQEAGTRAASALGSSSGSGGGSWGGRGRSMGSEASGLFDVKGLLKELGVDVATSTAGVSGGVSAFSGGAKGSFGDGLVGGSGKVSGSAFGADGSATATASALGVSVNAKGEAYLAKGSASGKVHLGDHLSAQGKVEGSVGANAGAGAHIGVNGANAHLGGFAGAKLDGEVGVDGGGVKANASGSVQAGIGAHASGQVGLGNDGKIHVGFSVGATLGIGASADVNFTVDPGEVVDTAKDLAGDVGNAAEDAAGWAHDHLPLI